MEPAENLRPVTLPDGVVELRIHGVSGTPPESLLKSTPVRIAGSAKSGFYRAGDGAGSGGQVEAYCWGGLTSGSRMNALWLLLLPFALLNVAGWMLPTLEGDPAELDRRARRLYVIARLNALGLTLLLAVAFLLVSHLAVGVDLPSQGVLGPVAELWVAIREHDQTRLAAALVMSSLVLAAFQLIAKVGAGGGEPGGLGADPLEAASAPAPPFSALWGQPGFVRSLGSLHLGAGFALLSIVGSLSVGDPVPVFRSLEIPSLVPGLLGTLGLVLGVSGLFAIRAESAPWTRRLERATFWVGLASLALAVLVALFSNGIAAPVGGSGDQIVFPDAAVVTVFVVIAVAVVILAVLAVAFHLMWGISGRFNSVAFTAWAFAAAVSAPSGLLLLFEQELASVNLAAWVFVVAGLAIAISFLWIWQPLGRDGPIERAERLRDAVDSSRILVRWSGIGLAGVFLLGVIWFLWTGKLSARGSVPDPRGAWGGLIGWTLVACAVAVVLRPRASWARLALAGVVGFIACVAVRRVVSLQGALSAAGVDLSLASDRFVKLAGLVAMVAPLLATGWFIVRASDRHNNRRAIGVFWDLANYWPQWFHPWAPVPYTETALPALKNRVLSLIEGGEVVVVSGHSQGAVMAVPVLHDAELADLGVRFLSYGCLIDRHYKDLFPTFFNDATFAVVDANVAGNWVNLYRNTDPLGHDVAYLADRSWETSVSEPDLGLELLTHSDYQYSVGYGGALVDLLWEPDGG